MSFMDLDAPEKKLLLVPGLANGSKIPPENITSVLTAFSFILNNSLSGCFILEKTNSFYYHSGVTVYQDRSK